MSKETDFKFHSATVGADEAIHAGFDLKTGDWQAQQDITQFKDQAKLDRDKDYSRQGSGSDYQKAMGLVKSMQPNTVYVYAMGLEPWFTYVLGLNYDKNSKQLKESDKFVIECNKQGIISERLFGQKELVQLLL